MARSKRGGGFVVNGVAVSPQRYHEYQEKLRKKREAAREKKEAEKQRYMRMISDLFRSFANEHLLHPPHSERLKGKAPAKTPSGTPRPRGRAPKDMQWDPEQGQWVLPMSSSSSRGPPARSRSRDRGAAADAAADDAAADAGAAGDEDDDDG